MLLGFLGRLKHQTVKVLQERLKVLVVFHRSVDDRLNLLFQGSPFLFGLLYLFPGLKVFEMRMYALLKAFHAV